MVSNNTEFCFHSATQMFIVVLLRRHCFQSWCSEIQTLQTITESHPIVRRLGFKLPAFGDLHNLTLASCSSTIRYYCSIIYRRQAQRPNRPYSSHRGAQSWGWRRPCHTSMDQVYVAKLPRKGPLMPPRQAWRWTGHGRRRLASNPRSSSPCPPSLAPSFSCFSQKEPPFLPALLAHPLLPFPRSRHHVSSRRGRRTPLRTRYFHSGEAEMGPHRGPHVLPRLAATHSCPVREHPGG